ncbi:MAG TPA: hypothetical protein VKD90_09430 [Gemmataceae bacterium]|nr:hypothetical protein [Gemmataceae bacterium]
MPGVNTETRPPLAPKQSKRLLTVLVVIAIISMILGLVLPFLQKPRFVADEIAAVEVSLIELPDQPEWQVTSADAAAIAALVEVLNTGDRVVRIMGEPTGTITLRQVNGDFILDFRPGDEDEYYEFRVRCGTPRGIYRVERQAFLSAMADLGVSDLAAEP